MWLGCIARCGPADTGPHRVGMAGIQLVVGRDEEAQHVPEHEGDGGEKF